MDNQNAPARQLLFGPEGKAYLEREYVALQRSTHEIAERMRTYHKLVRRALEHHKIGIRSRGEAQSSALSTGRAPHPTKGKPRPAAHRERISQSLTLIPKPAISQESP